MNTLLRQNLPLFTVTACAIGTGAYIYIKNQEREVRRPGWYPAYFKDLTKNTFQTRMNYGPWGEGDERKRIQFILPAADCEAILQKEVSSTSVKRAGNMVVRYDTNTVSVNQPNEDRFAVDIFSRLSLPALRASKTFWETWVEVKTELKEVKDDKGEGCVRGGSGGDDVMMFSVIDGHGGDPLVAALMKKVLHPTLAYVLGDRGGLVDDPARDVQKDDRLLFPFTSVTSLIHDA
jgi:hypothetical protein